MRRRVGMAVALSVLVLAGSVRASSVHPERLWTEAAAKKVRRERSQIAKVARRAMPAVVAISTAAASEEADDPQKGIGSGFVIHPDGYILTSSHVIEQAKEVTVTVQSPRGHPEEHAARVVGHDPHTDVALLKIEVGWKLPVLTLASAKDVEIADWVVVIGNPFGLAQSVTVGVVSFKGRTDVVPTGRDGYFDYLQTDAPINPGSSGGPILNLRGSVVAIANAVNVSGQGIGFGVPIDIAKAVVPKLEAEGTLRRGWLGLTVQDLTPDIAGALGEASYSGVLVSEVVPTGPAAQAGIEVGDVIIGLGATPMERAHALRWEVTIAGPGRTMDVVVRREGRPVHLPARLVSPPDERPPPSHLSLGASVTDVDDKASELAGLASPFGALVRSVDVGSPLEAAGLVAGDVVLKVNGSDVAGREQLVEALKQLPSGVVVRLFVRRGPSTLPLSLRVP